MPLISVIMPVYNTASFLRKSIESVLNQTFINFELICVNDGSTDNSLDILNEYASRDSRIIIINQENMGLSCARNSALEVARGEYIAFIDSDDFWAKSFLSCLYENLKIQPGGVDIVGCNFKKIKSATDDKLDVKCAKAKLFADALGVLLHPKNFIHFNVWNKLYRREVIGNIRFVEGMYYEDWVFNCMVFLRANGFAWVNSRLYGYNISDTSIMRSAFNERKLGDYVRGIVEVYTYFMENAPKLWEKVKRTRISRTVKMMMNVALRSKDIALIEKTKERLQELRQRGLITYRGLSFKNKIKLFIFLR